MKKLLLIALLFGSQAKAENIIFTAQQDPTVQAAIEEIVKPAAKAGIWAFIGYLTYSISF